MLTRTYYLLLILGMMLFSPLSGATAMPANDIEVPNAWVPVADGIDYQVFHLTNPRPINIFVAKMERSNPNLTVDSSIAQGKLSGDRETISGMAARYDQAINYWGGSWGSRNDVIVAINGYFFDPDGTIWSGLVNSGWYAKRFSENVGDAGFAWTLDQTAHIGSCVYHKGNKNFINFVRAGYPPNIRGVNIPYDEDDLILYTPQFDSNTRTESLGDTPKVEILIEMQRPTLIIPSQSYAKGYIREIRQNQGSTYIPFDHIVIAAWGGVGDAMLSRILGGEIVEGDEVRISQEITDCGSLPQNNWTKTYASIGGDYHFLNGGEVRTVYGNADAYVANSRTAIAFNDAYIFYVVVDAFDPGESMGMKIIELGNFLKDNLGATDAVSLDSGGSSTMVIHGEVVNNTYCNFTRNCGTQVDAEDYGKFEPINEKELEQLYGEMWSDSTGVLEPLVGTGMMMVVVDPAYKTRTFSPGANAIAEESTKLRLGPGTNYSSIGTMQAGDTGIFQDHMNELNGVYAKGSNWWNVKFGNMIGWVKEETLVGGHVTDRYKTFLPSLTR